MSAFPLFKFKIKRFQKEIEPQEVLLDALAQKKAEEFGASEQKLETPLSRRIFQGFWIVFLAMMFLFLGRLLQLQVLEGKTLTGLASENQFIVRSIQAERGVIYDSQLTQLVFNKPSFDLVCDGQVAKENLDHQTLLFYEVQINELPGCEIQNNTVREYFSGPVFSHTIGYQSRLGNSAGLEAHYDDILKSKPGQLKIQRDVHGNLLSKEIISAPEAGQSLVLWLDAGLQKKITETLARSLERIGSKAGAVVALDPKTGGVLALVSYPNFDNNLFSQGISQEQWEKIMDDPNRPLFNRAVSGIGYPTGSTIKPIIGLAALEEGVIGPDTRIYSPLEICIVNPWYPDKEDCYSDWQYHGTSDLRRAIAESVNTFFYQIGGGHKDLKGLGVSKIKKWLEVFGWGSQTGIDLPEEGEGVLPDIEKEWRLGDTYHLSIGQGPFAIPPLQVATAFVALANGGTIFQPQIVQKILNKEKEIAQEIEPRILTEIPFQKENLAVIIQGMRQAVTSPVSPSHILNDLSVAVAAKTGTAQTGRENLYHNWITVIAPYQDPQIVLTILIENVAGFQAAVLPVAKEVLAWYFSTPQALDKNSR